MATWPSSIQGMAAADSSGAALASLQVAGAGLPRSAVIVPALTANVLAQAL
jgi:hypothetical protein